MRKPQLHKENNDDIQKGNHQLGPWIQSMNRRIRRIILADRDILKHVFSPPIP
jgi:chorismate-pyruvate lyase